MHTVSVSFHATLTRLSFFDPEKAKAAYDKIQEAVKEYRKFKNDSSETIEVDTESGSATLKLEHIDCVIIEDNTGQEKLMRYEYETERLARSIRDELGLPGVAPRRLAAPAE